MSMEINAVLEQMRAMRAQAGQDMGDLDHISTGHAAHHGGGEGVADERIDLPGPLGARPGAISAA